MTDQSSGGFLGDPHEAFAPPAAGGCCGSQAATQESGCCGSPAATQQSGCCGQEPAPTATGCCG
ncbi:hypothetical protein [Nonomuraea gerenzanensis]|uniref:hypothetical protein n=1 Tax=Nonomuraea gerenzanensis TaxID=93944 RepID=UPI001CD99985|nr:hypothetical protein [Nonomuraea gerenzanensis]UBU14010.1 hypothetical protein LCN96_02955 [Nonomuraea gerenzanensis]